MQAAILPGHEPNLLVLLHQHFHLRGSERACGVRSRDLWRLRTASRPPRARSPYLSFFAPQVFIAIVEESFFATREQARSMAEFADSARRERAASRASATEDEGEAHQWQRLRGVLDQLEADEAEQRTVLQEGGGAAGKRRGGGTQSQGTTPLLGARVDAGR